MSAKQISYKLVRPERSKPVEGRGPISKKLEVGGCTARITHRLCQCYIVKRAARAQHYRAMRSRGPGWGATHAAWSAAGPGPPALRGGLPRYSLGAK